MSDDKTVMEVAEPKVDTTVQKEPLDAELKKVIAERDKAKAKLRDIEEKDRKALEEKAIEEGKLKEVLASRDAELSELKKYKEAVEAAHQAQRATVLEGIADPEIRKFAEKMTDAAEILSFVKLVEEKKLTTHNQNNAKTAPEIPKHKDWRSWEQAMNNPGGGLIPKL